MKKGLLRLPPGVSCISSFPNISISGPRGEVSIYLPIKFIQRGHFICFSRALKYSEMTLFKHSVYGVTLLYRIGLLLQGIGYKVEKKKSLLLLKLGYSHDIEINVPENIEVRLNKNEVHFYSARLVILKNFVSQIRKLRFPDPYKGSGILYEGEIVAKKEGKKM